MKKFLVATMIFGMLFMSTPTAQAFTLEELMQEVSNLKQEIANLKAKLTGQVLGSTIAKTFKKGMRDSEIAKFQEILIDKGFLSEGNATGYYGALTLQALQNFQKSIGLKADGILGPETQNKLISTDTKDAKDTSGAKGENTVAKECKSNTWNRKADMGAPGTIIERTEAVGFSIGKTGYIGTGRGIPYGDSIFLKDFWAWDQATNTWTQKADFGGTARKDAVGFSIGDKGYVGTGYNFSVSTTLFNDFWEYTPSTNTWTRKADFGGIARGSAVGFELGGKGYIGTGWAGANGTALKDFWEYNPATDAWTKKADFAGVARSGAVGFSISDSYIQYGRGYIGTGRSADYQFPSDFWEYNPNSDAWVKKADYVISNTHKAVGFSMGNKGYIGTGGTNYFWEYNPSLDSWARKADFGGGARNGAVGFSIENKGYIGTGGAGINGSRDLWEYCGDELPPIVCHPNTWTRRADFGGEARLGAFSFSVGEFGYIGAGQSPGGVTRKLKDMWQYSKATDTWTQRVDFPGGVKDFTAYFAIGNSGYVGTGRNNAGYYTNDFWQYNTTTNTWSQRANFGGNSRAKAVGFSIGDKGYMGMGTSHPTPIPFMDFWEYNPATNTWTQKASDPAKTKRDFAVGFELGGKGYLGTGGPDNSSAASLRKDFWEYDPVTNKWTRKADLGGVVRIKATGFSLGNRGYIGTGISEDGNNSALLRDFWAWDPTTNTWAQKADFGGSARFHSVGFSIGDKGYIGTGRELSQPNTNYMKDFWEYCPDTVGGE